MSKTTEQLKNVDLQATTAIKSNTKELVRYCMQLAMLNRLLSHELVTEKEYHKVSEQLKSDYGMAAV